MMYECINSILTAQKIFFINDGFMSGLVCPSPCAAILAQNSFMDSPNDYRVAQYLKRGEDAKKEP